ncbi:MAG: HEAT repeat domain-containing protein [Leptolyngbya sp. SIO4C1]|nr:HEAT repeat domain-containing protein [Leptolyngbya sp. SIO4C1]
MSKMSASAPDEPSTPKVGTQPYRSMNHPAAKVRLAAVHEIAQQARQNQDHAALRLLTEALNDADADVRVLAASQLGQLQCEEAYQPLIACLKDGAPNVRIAAAEALGRLGNSDAIAALEPLERDADRSVQTVAERVIDTLMKTLT